MITSKTLPTYRTLTSHKAELDKDQQKLLKTYFPKGITYVGMMINLVFKLSVNLAARLTMFMFSISISKPLKENDIAFYSNGRQRKFKQGSYKFNVYEYGQGPKVLLVHGWTCSGARWKRYVDEIVSAGYTAIVMDAPGHGTSPGYCLPVPEYILCVEEVINFYDGLHSMITHSMGSLVAAVALSRSNHSEDNISLVIMNSFADCDSLISRFAKCIGIADEVMEHTREWITNYTYAPLKYFSMVDHFENINAQILYIADKQDIVVPPVEVTKILSSSKSINFLQTTGLGHRLRSDDVISSVLDHIDTPLVQ